MISLAKVVLSAYFSMWVEKNVGPTFKITVDHVDSHNDTISNFILFLLEKKGNNGAYISPKIEGL